MSEDLFSVDTIIPTDNSEVILVEPKTIDSNGLLLSGVVEGPSSETLEQKRRDDLLKNLKLLETIRQRNSDHSTRYRLEEVEKYLNMDPREFAALREQFPYLDSDFLGCLRDIRKIRNSQRDYVNKKLKELPEGATELDRRHALIEALSYSPLIGEQILDTLTKKSSSAFESSGKLLSTEEAREAAMTKEGFEEKLSQLLITQPEIVLSEYVILLELVGRKKIQNAFYRLLEVSPDSMKYDFYLDVRLKAVFESDEQVRLFLSEYIRVVPDFALDIVKEEKFSIYFEKEYVDNLLEDLIAKGMSGLAFYARDLYSAGRISEEQLLRYLETLDEKGYGDKVNLNKLMIFASEKKSSYSDELNPLPESVKARAKEKILENLALGNLYSWDLKELTEQGFISDEELSESIGIYLEKDAAGILKMFGREGIERGFYSKELAVQTVKDILNAQMPSSFKINDVFDLVIDFGVFNPGEFREYLNQLEVTVFLGLIKAAEKHQIFTHEEITQRISKEIKSMNSSNINNNLKVFAEYLTPDEVIELINRITDSGEFITDYNFKEMKEDIGEVDVRELRYRLLDAMKRGEVEIGALDSLLKSIEDIDGLQTVKGIAKELLQTFPPLLIVDLIERSDRYFDEKDIKNCIESIIKSENGGESLLENLVFAKSRWTRYVDKKIVSSIILDQPNTNYSILRNAILSKDRLVSFITEEEHKSLVYRYIQLNPADALLNLAEINKTYPDITESEIISYVNGSRCPGNVDKYLQETVSRAVSMDKESSKKILLTEAAVTYAHIAFLEKNGALGKVGSLISSEGLTRQQAMSTIESYSVAIKLNGLENMSDVETSKEVDSKLLGIILEITGGSPPEYIYEATMERIAPAIRALGVYITKHRSSEGHRLITKEIVQSLINGNYKEWKFGAATSEDIERMKQGGLYPRNLSVEQLSAWAQDTSTELQDSFSVEAEETSQEMTRTLLAQLEAFGLSIDDLVDVRSRISTIGAEIAKIDKQKQLLKSSPDKDLALDQMSILQKESESLRTQLKKLQLIEDLNSLIAITPDQVKAGAIINESNQKTRSIGTILKRVSANAPVEAQDLIEQVNALLGSYKSQTGEISDMVISDESDLMTTLRVGVEPVGSCQNYRTGQLNEALFGYTDPNTKIIVLRNQKGAPIGRAIFRLLEDQNGNPSLHVDTIYSTNISDGARRAVYQHAKKKAEQMGVPLYISQVSQNEDGVNLDARDIEGVELSSAEGVSLISNGSRAPSVYVDSAGGIQERGIYILKNLKTVSL